MHINRTLRSLALALTAATCHLAAADIQWGATAGLGFPAKDLKDAVDNAKGFTLGAQVFMDLGNGHGVRPRLDIARFRSPRITYLGVSDVFTVDTLRLGADYLYHFTGETKGAYAFGGMGGVYTRSTTTLSIGDLGLGSARDHVTKAYVQVGAGYQINRHWGVELYHAYHRTTSSHDFAATFLAATARF